MQLASVPNAIETPVCPGCDEFYSIFKFARGVIWKVWVTWPNSQEEDKREAVLECIQRELKDQTSFSQFKIAVDSIVVDNLCIVMEAKGLTQHFRY